MKNEICNLVDRCRRAGRAWAGFLFAALLTLTAAVSCAGQVLLNYTPTIHGVFPGVNNYFYTAPAADFVTTNLNGVLCYPSNEVAGWSLVFILPPPSPSNAPSAQLLQSSSGQLYVCAEMLTNGIMVGSAVGTNNASVASAPAPLIQ
jgi:hypothetical protein